MDELQELRGEIDAIDTQLTDLFQRRMKVAGEVGQYKLERGLPVLDRAREAEVLAKKAALAEEPFKGDVMDLFETIMAISRRRQQRLMAAGEAPSWLRDLNAAMEHARDPVPKKTARIFYQGEPGAYAEEAAVDFFGEDCRRDRAALWEDIFVALRDGRADYGVLPIENSSTGSINQVYDLLAKYGGYIVGEQTVRVNHCLLAPRGTDISALRRVFSHEQGLLQCAEYLKTHPDWEQTALRNTALAAKKVAQDGDPAQAAIGSRRCAALYGLDILAEGINSNRENFTRFVVVSPVVELREGREKVSLLFTLSHQSGTLYRLLSVFAHEGLNLLKLESRPIPDRPWEYRFFVDFTGDLTAPGMAERLRDAAETAEDFRVLGNY